MRSVANVYRVYITQIVFMYLRQTGRYFLPSRESFQSIVLSSQFDWLAFFEVAGSSN